MKFNKKRFLYVLITIAVIAIFVSSRGFRNLIKRKLQQYRLEKGISQIINENAKLKQEIYLLKNDKSYMEHLIRRDLGYIKPDEVEYRFKRKTKPESK